MNIALSDIAAIGIRLSTIRVTSNLRFAQPLRGSNTNNEIRNTAGYITVATRLNPVGNLIVFQIRYAAVFVMIRIASGLSGTKESELGFSF